MNTIVEQINKSIADALDGLKLNVNGIAEAVLVRDGEDTILPAIVDLDGECKMDLFDDGADVGIYHRMNDVAYTIEDAGGYGNAHKKVSTFEMSVIAFGIRERINPNHLEKIVCDCIGKQGGTITSSSFNRLTIFASEFQGVPFFLQPNIFLFRTNYQIRKTTKC